MLLAVLNGAVLVLGAYALTGNGAVGLAGAYVIMGLIQTAVNAFVMFWLLRKTFVVGSPAQEIALI